MYLTLEELEALRLVDLLELEQEEAAFYMGISRKAFWNDLMSARRKVTTALAYGTGIRIEGGSFLMRGAADAARSETAFSATSGEDETALQEKELHVLKARLAYLSVRMAFMKGGGSQGKASDGNHPP
jgi:hypothetical protein